MLKVESSEKAVEQLVELARDGGADDTGLDELARHLETVAAHPEMAEPARHPIGRGHMTAVHLFDGTGRMWGFTVPLFFLADRMVVRAVLGAPAPAGSDG